MTRQRDLFRAIVLSGAAVTSLTGCPGPTGETDAGRDAGAREDSPLMVADAPITIDAPTGNDAGEDAFVAIL